MGRPIRKPTRLRTFTWTSAWASPPSSTWACSRSRPPTGNSSIRKRAAWCKETCRLVRIHKANGLPAPKVLNLFAYTGAASLAAKCAGADVTHLDSVRQVVTWARENMERSGLDGIRWVVEDALKFARREAKRGNKYDGIILDPPAYGHGPDGEKWKLDELLFGLLQNVSAILSERDAFMVLNLYSNGYSAALGETVVREAFHGAFKEMNSGELAFNDGFGKVLPLSIFVRLKR